MFNNKDEKISTCILIGMKIKTRNKEDKKNVLLFDLIIEEC